MRPDELALLLATARAVRWLATFRHAPPDLLTNLREALRPFEPPPQPSLADLEDAVPPLNPDFDWAALQQLRKQSP